MLKSDELLNCLNSKLSNIDDIEDLKEKENLLNECKSLKAQYREALESEAQENLEIIFFSYFFNFLLDYFCKLD